MDDQRAWFSEAARRRVTTTEIANYLNVTRKTAQSRLDAGLSSDDIIIISRAIKISPMDALLELGKLTYPEVYGFIEREGKLLGTASDGELALELAQRLNSLRDAQDWWAVHDKVQALNNRPAANPKKVDNVHPLTQPNQPPEVDQQDGQSGLRYVADNSPREDGHGGDVGAWDA